MPVVVTPPGDRAITQVPAAGKPFNTTLPVGIVAVGCVIVPTTGALIGTGCEGITTLGEGTDKHPSFVVTVKLYVPVWRPVMVVLVPLPVEDTVPGYRINVHVPEEGKPDNATLPDGNAQVGGAIVPTDGAGGINGCGFIRTLAEGTDAHPPEFVTINVYAPAKSVEIVAVVPVPVINTPSGFLVMVQVPITGKPLKSTLPVEIEQVGCEIVPITGAEGEAGCVSIITLDDATETHP